MIGKLRGKVDAVGESHLILDVNGVGYEVQASARTLRNLKHGLREALRHKRRASVLGDEHLLDTPEADAAPAPEARARPR